MGQHLFFYANLAQSVEHLPRKEKVGGSIPLVGIFLFSGMLIGAEKLDISTFLIFVKPHKTEKRFMMTKTAVNKNHRFRHCCLSSIQFK